MAATIAATNTSTNSGVTNHTAALPPDIAAGDLLLLLISIRRDSFTGNATISSPPSGFTLLDSQGLGTISHATASYVKKATGGEGASVSFSSAATCNSAIIALRITGWADTGTVTDDVEISTVATAIDDSPDPDSLTPSWGSADTLWIAFAGYPQSFTASGYPTDYTAGPSAILSTTRDVSAISAYRTYTTDTEDPGAFTITSGIGWDAWTIGVAPGGGVQDLKINVGDALKPVTAMKVNVGDALKEVTAMKINVGDALKEIFPG